MEGDRRSGSGALSALIRNKAVDTPAYIIDEAELKNNLKILSEVEKRSGCHILLAQKAYSAFATYPLISEYISGTTASGLFEARLGHEEMKGECHVYSPAYTDEEIDELVGICDHIIFNSVNQMSKYNERCRSAGCDTGIRINPECSTQDHPIYDPCAPGSRLGITRSMFEACDISEITDRISGLHFHTLCEQNFDALKVTVEAVERKFGDILAKPNIKWLNMGGGHHITREDYDREGLINLIRYISEKYNVTVYLEPGEAVAYRAGYLISKVLDIVCNEIPVLILDTSAACHMPDVLEMPYTPPLSGAKIAGVIEKDSDRKEKIFRLSSRTCLAGDIIGDYIFDTEPETGDILCFEDMAIYSMVKNNTFNGMNLPAICILHEDGRYEKIREFGYEDFKGRLS